MQSWFEQFGYADLSILVWHPKTQTEMTAFAAIICMWKAVIFIAGRARYKRKE